MKHFGWNKYVLLYEQDVKVSDADESGILYIVKDECMCVGKSNKKDIRVHCSPLYCKHCLKVNSHPNQPELVQNGMNIC